MTSNLPALAIPSSLAVADLHQRCAMVVEWANEQDDVERLDEARRWLAAVEAYLGRKKAAGPAMTAARLVEARIGHLDAVYRDTPASKEERYQFRQMDEHRNVWEHLLPLSRSKVLSQIRAVRQEAALDADEAIGPEPDIRLGDFRTVLADVPDGSVDLILTDPPYPSEFLPLWTGLGEFAARVLRPGGSLAAMSGQSFLPELMTRLGDHLTYHWTLAYLTPGGQAVQVFPRKVNTFWKPILWYVKGEYAGRWVGDVAKSAVNDNDKRRHEWGQSGSGMWDLLTRLAEPSHVICDPFMGGGTTALVARRYGCSFVGAELDPASHEIALRRIAA